MRLSSLCTDLPLFLFSLFTLTFKAKLTKINFIYTKKYVLIHKVDNENAASPA